jgi:carbonic anhydrase
MPTPEILAGVQEFQEHYWENREEYQRLATQGQSPEVLVIGCSDSRVPPDLLTRVAPGSLFSMRCLGNVVPPFGSGEMSAGAVVEYAVLTLKVKHILITGHTDCGAVRALDKPPDWSTGSHIARWIEYARPAKTAVDARGLPAEDRHLAVVRANVLLQLEHLRSYEPIRAGERAGTLTLHGWVYDLETGTFQAHGAQSGIWEPVVQ